MCCRHGSVSTGRQQNKGWSGDRRTDTFNYTDSGVIVNIENDQEKIINVPTAPVKEQPIWMRQSTVKGADQEDMIMVIWAYFQSYTTLKWHGYL